MKLVHASLAETGGTGWDGKAKAGDQNGKEVCVRSWYQRPWNLMIRYPDSDIASRAAHIAVALAQSTLVGYDQSARNSLYSALKAFNFDVPSYIASGKKSECDCSSFIYAVYACLLPKIRSDANAPTTAVMRKSYAKWGFSVSTNSGYLIGNQLKSGDIMVREGVHTAIVTDVPTAAKVQKRSDLVDAALNVIAKDVLAGHWGNGAERKDRLYTAVQIRVNELLK